MIRWLSELCSYVMDNIAVWIVGIMFVLFFALAAAGMLFGVKLGPKDKID